MIVAELFARLGFRVDKASIKNADNAVRGASKRMAKSTKKVRKQVDNLNKGFNRLARRIATGFVLKKAWDSLIGFNATMEQMRDTTAGLLAMSFDTDLASQLQPASDVMEELRQRAAKSTATTQEMVSFMREVVGPLSQAGLATEDLAEFTANAVIAAKAFGDEGIAAFDIQQALTQNVKIRDRFMRKLLLSVKMSREEFNRLGQSERLAVIQRALTSDQISQLAEKQAKSFAGVWSTLKDNIQIALGKVGLPLFRRLTVELQKLTKWIADNPEKLQEWIDAFSEGLVSIFNMSKNLLKFLTKHWKILLALLIGGKTLAGIRALAASFGAVGGAATGGTAAASAGILGLLGPIGMVAAALTALTATKWWEELEPDSFLATAQDTLADMIEKAAVATGLAEEHPDSVAKAEKKRHAGLRKELQALKEWQVSARLAEKGGADQPLMPANIDDVVLAQAAARDPRIREFYSGDQGARKFASEASDAQRMKAVRDRIREIRGEINPTVLFNRSPLKATAAAGLQSPLAFPTFKGPRAQAAPTVINNNVSITAPNVDPRAILEHAERHFNSIIRSVPGAGKRKGEPR